MSLEDHPDILEAYDRTVEALYYITGCTDNEAEEFIDSMADLIFTTMQTYLKEEEKNEPHNH